MLCLSVTGRQVHNATLLSSSYCALTELPFLERRLAYDDKPRRIFKKLQEEKTNPTFVLKHVLDIDRETQMNAGERPHSSHNVRPLSDFTYAIAIHPYRTGKGAPFNVVP